MSKNTDNHLDRLFFPRSIAVVGASPRNGERVQGNNYIKGSISQNFKGKIYPVHPKAESILGFKAYKSVRDIPDEVDLAIFTVPASAVLNVMEDCVAKGVQFVHLFTAGFSETGVPEYAEIERELVALARKGGIRIVGPNCMGLYCPDGGLSFQPFFPPTSGSVGFFSQSGQLTGFFVMQATMHKLAFSKAVSFGNATDLKAHDFLTYLAQDKKTKVIGSYIEGLTDGRDFFDTAKSVTPTKPLVIYKGGQTDGGSRATQSHTAAIAGSPKIWNALVRQAGIISVNSLEEMACTISALQRLPLPKGENIAIMGGAGGGSVTMTDIAEKVGLKVPHLSPETVQKLGEFIPPAGNSIKNPLDIGFEAFSKENFSKLISYLNHDPHIDALIFLQPIGIFQHIFGRFMVDILIELTLGIKDQFKKPVMVVIEKNDAFGGTIYTNLAEDKYHEANMPTFPSFELAAKVLRNLNNYQRFLSSQNGQRK